MAFTRMLAAEGLTETTLVTEELLAGTVFIPEALSCAAE